jgi:hypothetical protein
MRRAEHIKYLPAAILLLPVAVMLMGAGLPEAKAQSEDSSQTQEGQSQEGRGQGIEISPPRLQIDADPGETVTTEIKVRNITDLNMRVESTVNDFVAGNKSGEPRILFGDEESPYPLKKYISDVPSLTLEPKERRGVTVEINVPGNAAPGGHFGLVQFKGVPAGDGNQSSQVNVAASVGTLILLSVSGEIQEQMVVDRLAVSQDGNAGSFFEGGPFRLITELDNTGNVHLEPTGSLTITNLFGQEVAGAAFNKNKGNVLPGKIRRFENAFGEKERWVGRYTATAQLQYGSDNTVLKEQVSFWVIPYKIIGIILLMLAAIIFFGRRALTAYKRNILRQYQQQQQNSDHSADSDDDNPRSDQHPPGE